MAIEERCGGSRTKFSEIMGWKSPARVQRYITAQESGRNIGHKLAREIEERLGLPLNYMDTPAVPPVADVLRIAERTGAFTSQLVALFNALSPERQDKLIGHAQRLFSEEYPDEISPANPFGLKSVAPHAKK